MTSLPNCSIASPLAFSWAGGVSSVLWTVRCSVLYNDWNISCHSWWPVLSDFQWTVLAPLPSWLSLLLSFLPTHFYSAVHVLGHETAKQQISSMFAWSECTESAFSILPRQFTAQGLTNTHRLENFMFSDFARKTYNFFL